MIKMEYESRIKKSKNRLKENENILEENKEAILGFDRDMRLNDYSDARRYKYLTTLPQIAEQMDVIFDEADKSDIEDVVLWAQERDDLNQTTVGDYKILLKRFMKFVNGGEYPESVEWLNTTRKKADNDVVPEDLLTEDDIMKLLENCMNERDKALISLLWETGARIGEIMDLTIGSIETREHGFKVVLDGKTGRRRNPLISSTPHLRKWIENVHPNGDNKDAPLFVNIGTVGRGEAMSYSGINKMLKDVRDRTDIDKPVRPHHFRHSRATFLANKFTEAQMCEWFGWVQGSDVPGQYVHLSGRDIDESYDQLHGIEPDDKPQESKLTPDSCPRCNEDVDSQASYCDRCGQALQWTEVKPDLSAELQKDAIKHSVLKDLEDSGVKEEIVEELKDDIKHLEAVKELDEEN